MSWHAVIGNPQWHDYYIVKWFKETFYDFFFCSENLKDDVCWHRCGHFCFTLHLLSLNKWYICLHKQWHGLHKAIGFWLTCLNICSRSAIVLSLNFGNKTPLLSNAPYLKHLFNTVRTCNVRSIVRLNLRITCKLALPPLHNRTGTTRS